MLLIINLIVSLIILVALLMWISAMISQVAILRADVDMLCHIQRSKVVRDAVKKGYEYKDFEDKSIEEIAKMVYLCE